MKKFITEFKEFISRGNVIDMAVGVVIGTAFTKIINSLVTNIITPLIGIATGKVNLASLKWVITPASEAEGVAELSVTYGEFLQAILDFLIIAFVIFCVVKMINTMRERLARKQAEEIAEEVAEETPAEPTTEELLTEIRDLLKENK